MELLVLVFLVLHLTLEPELPCPVIVLAAHNRPVLQ